MRLERKETDEMKSIKSLEEMYGKEVELAKKHKKNAADIRREIELLKGSMINKKANALNLNGAEYDKFIKFLENDKKTVLDAIDLIAETEEKIEKDRVVENAKEMEYVG